MKVQISLQRTVDLGDHGERIQIAIDADEKTTVKELVEKYLYDSRYGIGLVAETLNHIEIRVCEDTIENENDKNDLPF